MAIHKVHYISALTALFGKMISIIIYLFELLDMSDHVLPDTSNFSVSVLWIQIPTAQNKIHGQMLARA